MDQEKYLKERLGSTRPFSVPEGYFDNLSARIMDNIAAQTKEDATDTVVKMEVKSGSTNYKRLRLFRPLIAAASMVGIIICASIAFQRTASSQEIQPKDSDETLNKGPQSASIQKKSSFDESADYMMLDDDDLYAYMTE